MRTLLDGSQLHRLLKSRTDELQGEYHIQDIDIRIMRNIKKGMDYSLLQDLIELGVFNDSEIADSLKRLHKQGLIKLVRDENNIQALGFKLTRIGTELWDKLQADYDYATKILFDGMTEEQVNTFKRLSQLVAQNVDKELEKRDTEGGLKRGKRK